MTRIQGFSVFGLIVVTLIWGFTFVVVQEAIQKVSPYTFLTVRFLFATLLMGILLLVYNSYLKRRNKAPLGSLLQKSLLVQGTILGVLLALGFIFQTLGLQYTTSSNAGFITGLNVVFTPLLLFLLYRYRPSAASVIGIVVALIGLFFLTYRGELSINRGDALTLVCAIAFAAHIIFTGRYVQKHNPFLLTIVQLFTVCWVSFLCTFIFDGGIEWTTWNTWFDRSFMEAILITALFATTFGYIMQSYAQVVLTPTSVAMIFICEPVFAAVAGVMLAGETITTLGYVGCVLILVGTIAVENPKVFSFLLPQKTKQKQSLSQ